MNFAETFNRLVGPVLKERCRVQGFFIALGESEFIEAHSAVAALAYARGAAYLPDVLQIALDQWIAETLLKYADEFTPAAEESARVADRVAAEARNLEAKWKMMTTT